MELKCITIFVENQEDEDAAEHSVWGVRQSDLSFKNTDDSQSLESRSWSTKTTYSVIRDLFYSNSSQTSQRLLFQVILFHAKGFQVWIELFDLPKLLRKDKLKRTLSLNSFNTVVQGHVLTQTQASIASRSVSSSSHYSNENHRHTWMQFYGSPHSFPGCMS
jgi:hypothetical protein